MGRLDLLLLVVWGRFGSGLTAGLRPVDGERPRKEWTEGLGERVTEREEEDFGEGVAGGGMHATPGRGVLTTCPSFKQESWEAGTVSTSRDDGGPERRTPGRTKPPRPRWNPQGSQADHTRITYVNIFLFILLFVNVTAGASTTYTIYTIYTIYNNTGFFALILTIYNIRTELKGRLGPFTSVSNNRPWDLWVIHRHTLHRRGRQRRTLGLKGGGAESTDWLHDSDGAVDGEDDTSSTVRCTLAETAGSTTADGATENSGAASSAQDSPPKSWVVTDRSTSGPSTTSGTAAGGTTGSSSTLATGADGGGSWGGGAPSVSTLACEMAFLLATEASTLVGAHRGFVSPFTANIADQGLPPKPKPTDRPRDKKITGRISL